MKIAASLAFFAAIATAQSVIESASFGYGSSLSPNRDTIPGWQVGGEGHSPQILSNKLILTPPYPGNTRGYVWSQTPVAQSEWTAELQFRASGVERGGGNLQLWFAKDGQSKIGTSSIYTVGAFDGLALVVDMHGGRGGSVRGFLNDGTKDYKSQTSVDSLAFGHCDYSYRNLGRPSVLRIKHSKSVFEVTVDDRVCFSTDKVAIPAGNTFGITAATPENPDSFEIFKFVVQSAQSGSAGSVPVPRQNTQQQPIAQAQGSNAQQQQQQQQQQGGQSIDAQFMDLSSRIQLISHATNNVIRELSNQGTRADSRQTELLQRMATKEQVAGLDARLQRMETLLQNIQRDLAGKDYRERFSQLEKTLQSSHLSLTESLQGHILHVMTASTPRMGFFIFVIIGVQVLLAGSYIVYKRRKANMPKKFL